MDAIDPLDCGYLNSKFLNDFEEGSDKFMPHFCTTLFSSKEGTDVRHTPLRLIKDWTTSQQGIDFLHVMFPKEAIDLFLKEHQWKDIKTKKGFQKICALSKEIYDQNIIYLGDVIHGKSAWERINPDFLKSIKNEEERRLAENALNVSHQALLESIPESDPSKLKKIEIYMLAMQANVLDFLEEERMLPHKKKLLAMSTQDFINVAKKTVTLEDSDSPLLKMISLYETCVTASVVLKYRMRVALMRAENGIYPAIFASFAAEEGVGLLGCPYHQGKPANPNMVKAHGETFCGAGPVFRHDLDHVRAKLIWGHPRSLLSIDKIAESIEDSSDSCEHLYAVLAQAVLGSDTTVADFSFLELVATLVKNTKDITDVKSRIKDICKNIQEKALFGYVVQHSLFNACKSTLRRFFPVSVQIGQMNFFNYTNNTYRLFATSPFYVYALCVGEIAQQVVSKYNAYFLWRNSVVDRKNVLDEEMHHLSYITSPEVRSLLLL